MGIYDYLLLAGAVAALALGATKFSRVVSYLAFLIIAVLPVYNAPENTE